MSEDGRLLGGATIGLWTIPAHSPVRAARIVSCPSHCWRPRPRGGGRFASAVVGLLLAVSVAPAGAVTDPAPIVAGVSEVVSVGAVGPIFPVADEWVPVVGGDDDTTFPNLLVVARDYGLGRALAFGHGGTLVETGVRDNGLFALNAAAWLDVPGGKRIGYSTGHGEWLRDGGPNGWAAALAPHGYTAVPVAGPLDAAALAGVDVLLVGDAWGTIQPAEVEAVRAWVADGHGLLMVGLGWSWDAYHPGAYEDFPMHLLAAPYGVRWARSGIWDPTDNLDGSPVFHTFHPDLFIGGPGDATAAIDTAHATHGGALATTLESDATERVAFVRAHQTLALVCRELPLGHPLRATVFDGLAALAAQEPAFYARLGPFDAATVPTAAWLRERMLRTWLDCLEPTAVVRTQIADALQMSGRRRDVLVELGVGLYDDDRLEPQYLDFIYSFLPLVPDGLTDLRGISVVDFLGQPPMPIGLEGAPQAFNIYASDAAYNQFPPEVPPGAANDTAVVIAHEMNHQVDAHTIASDATLHARHQQLIADAGDEPLNYLRSMIGAGYFTQNPQEFFASIANQWFVDSAKTVQLGLVRFDAGRPDPINQALFFAEVYSQGGDVTYFYEIDVAGSISRETIPIARNAEGFIDEITFDGVTYRFTLDPEGRVTGYTSFVACDPAPAPGCRTPFLAGKGRLQMKTGTSASKNQLAWKWSKGTSIAPEDFGDPLASTSYRLCVYGAGDAGLLAETAAPAGGACRGKPCWKPLGNPAFSRGAKYKDPDLTPTGVLQMLLKPGIDGKARIQVKARGASLSLPSLPLTSLPLTVQLHRSDDPICWEATFDAPRVNQDGRFKATSAN